MDDLQNEHTIIFSPPYPTNEFRIYKSAEDLIESVRHIGSSLGILIPMGIIKKESIIEGNEIEIGILKKDVKLLEEAFGSVKNPKFKFKRDTKNRI